MKSPTCNNRYTAATEEWASQWQRCWRCGKSGMWPWLQMHHFVRGAFKQKNNLETIVMLCPACHHDKEHNGDSLGLVGCLALKWIHDPEYYNRIAVNRVRGRAEDAVSWEEVQAEVKKLK